MSRDSRGTRVSHPRYTQSTFARMPIGRKTGAVRRQSSSGKCSPGEALWSTSPSGRWRILVLPARTSCRVRSSPSLAAQQDFLNLRKDADTDIPILQEAKAEYAKLQ